MRRAVPLALVLAAALGASRSFAQAASPLATGLEALRTSDYAKAEQELSHVRGADAAAAQVALAS